MTINSVVFIFGFLPVVLIVYYLAGTLFTKHGYTVRRIILFIASLIFFMWVAKQYILFLLIIVFCNYLIARFIDACHHKFCKQTLLAFGIIGNVATLFYYKYFGFFTEQLDTLFGLGLKPAAIIQPLGISFLVLSLIAYLIDVYRNTIPADKNVLNVSLWALFFPKITSGPIVRYHDMFNDDTKSMCAQSASVDNIAYGIRRLVIGLAKKVIIADTLGLTVDSIFTAQVTGINTPTAWLGIICYTFQIFFDFAGYSDMAIGLAALFGFRFKENFNYPYISKTVGEFWRRWHISLSTWLRDYLYFPLGGSRRGNVYFNLLVVFLVSGLWHGASWHFVFWGLWYGIFMIFDRIYRKYANKIKIPAAILWLGTMAVVVFGWVFFRAENMTQAIEYFGLLFGIGSVDTQFFGFSYYCNLRVIFLLIVAAICSTPLFAHLRKKHEGTVYWESCRLVGICGLFVVSILFMVNSTYSPFLYAQF